MNSLTPDVFGVITSAIEWSLAHISPVEGVMIALTFFAWVGTVAYARQVRAVPRPQDMVARQIGEAAAAREEASR